MRKFYSNLQVIYIKSFRAERCTHQKCIVFSSVNLDSTRQNRLSNYTVGWIKVWLSSKNPFPLATALIAWTWKSLSPHKRQAGTGRPWFLMNSPVLPATLGRRNNILPRPDVLEQAPLAGQPRMCSSWTFSKHSVTAWLAEKINTLMCLAEIISSPVWGNNVKVSLQLEENIAQTKQLAKRICLRQGNTFLAKQF